MLFLPLGLTASVVALAASLPCLTYMPTVDCASSSLKQGKRWPNHWLTAWVSSPFAAGQGGGGGLQTAPSVAPSLSPARSKATPPQPREEVRTAVQIAYVNVLCNKKVRLYRGTFAELSSGIKANWPQKCAGSTTPRRKDDCIRLL